MPRAPDRGDALTGALSRSRKARPLWLRCGELRRRFLKLSGFDFTERHQTVLCLVPQHKPYAPKALQERYVTDLAQFRVVAQHARQLVKGDTTAEMVHVVDANVGCEPAQQYRKIVM